MSTLDEMRDALVEGLAVALYEQGWGDFESDLMAARAVDNGHFRMGLDALIAAAQQEARAGLVSVEALREALRGMVKAAESDIPTPRVYVAMKKARAALAAATPAPDPSDAR